MELRRVVNRAWGESLRDRRERAVERLRKRWPTLTRAQKLQIIREEEARKFLKR